MKAGPRVREIFDRYGVSEDAREEILRGAVEEVAYRERDPEEAEGRLLRAVERRSASWRAEEDPAEGAVDARDDRNGEHER